MSFFKTVHQIVRNIPTGRVMSFGDIAGLMGEPRKARFVGFAMRACPYEYPWHRVVKADGSLVIGERQRVMLEHEGSPLMPTAGWIWINARSIRPRCIL